MADSTTWLVLGLAAGIGLGIGIAVLMREPQPRPAEGVSAVEFHRDEQGRIAGFERIGVGAGVGLVADAPR